MALVGYDKDPVLTFKDIAVYLFILACVLAAMYVYDVIMATARRLFRKKKINVMELDINKF